MSHIVPIPQVMQNSNMENLYHIEIDQYDKVQFEIKGQKGFSSSIISYLSLQFTLTQANEAKSIFFYVENKPMKEDTIWRMVYKSNAYAVDYSNSNSNVIKANTIVICTHALIYPSNPELSIVVCKSESSQIIGYAFFSATIQHLPDNYNVHLSNQITQRKCLILERY